MTADYTPPPPVTSAAGAPVRRALLAVWAVGTLGALAFVAVLGTNAPYADEWEFVPALVGAEPELPWLWQQHNEHRMPLPRLVVLTYFRLTGDFRAGMFLQVAMLSALALYLMRFAEQLRGRPHWADVFFPVSLLHIGHWENLVMGYQVCFVLFAVLTTSLVVTALRATPENAFKSGVCAGVVLLLLALTNGSGLVMIPPVGLWLGFLAFKVWRGSHCGAGVPPASAEAGGTPAPQQNGSKGRAVVLLLLALLPVAYLAIYFQGYERPAHHPPMSTSVERVATVTGEVLAVSFGMGLSEVWPPVALGVVAVGVLTLVRVVRAWKEPARRLSVAGLVAVVAGVTGVALAVGTGRAGFEGWALMGLWSRYSMLSWPLLAAAYLVWARRAKEQNGGLAKWVPIALCVTAALAFPGNTATGMMNGGRVASDYAGIAAQAQAGLSAEEIVDSKPFSESHHAAQGDRAVRAIPLLRAARVGIFAR